MCDFHGVNWRTSELITIKRTKTKYWNEYCFVEYFVDMDKKCWIYKSVLSKEKNREMNKKLCCCDRVHTATIWDDEISHTQKYLNICKQMTCFVWFIWICPHFQHIWFHRMLCGRASALRSSLANLWHEHISGHLSVPKTQCLPLEHVPFGRFPLLCKSKIKLLLTKVRN